MKLKPLPKVKDIKSVKKFAWLPVTLDSGIRILWEFYQADCVYSFYYRIGNNYPIFYWRTFKTYQL